MEIIVSNFDATLVYLIILGSIFAPTVMKVRTKYTP